MNDHLRRNGQRNLPAFLVALILCLTCMGAAFRVIQNLQDLTNVKLAAAPTNGQVLAYNSTLGAWTNSTDAGLVAMNQNQFDTTSTNLKSGATVTNLVVRQSAGNALTVNTNVLVVGTNKVGIGIAVPLAPLHVGDYPSLGSVDAQVLIAREVNNTIAGNGHAFADNSNIARSGSIGYNSFDAKTTVGGGVDYDHYAGYQSRLTYANTPGVMLNYYGYHDVLTVNSGTVLTNFGAYYIDSLGAGTVRDSYGIYLGARTNATNQNFAIYTAGATKSVFGGTVKVGQLQYSATPAGAADVGVFRYSGDVIEINNGTIGNRRDLMLRALWDSGGNQVVSTRQAAVADAAATAGTATLAGWGFLTQAEFDAHIAAVNALKDQVNDLLEKLRTHGLIAP